MVKFEQCLNGGEEATVRRDVEEGRAMGVEGTPTVFLAFRDGNNQIKVLKRIMGAQPYSEFRAAIQAALKESQN